MKDIKSNFAVFLFKTKLQYEVLELISFTVLETKCYLHPTKLTFDDNLILCQHDVTTRN